MDWIFRYAGPNLADEEIIQITGAVLAGRRSYNVGKRADQPAEARALRRRVERPGARTHARRPERRDPTVRFLAGDISAAVATARQVAGAKNVVLIGANVARQCLDAGLVDEIVIHLAPILLGNGIHLFGDPAAAPINLEAISITRAGQVANRRFRVAS